MLRINNLSKYFSRQLILDNLSFEINNHEIIAIIGPNGCGKTTLIKIIAGLEEKDQGLTQIDKDNKKITTGLIFQNYREQILPWKTVEQNIDFSLSIHTKNKLEKKYTTKKLLKQTGLYKHRHQYFYELSGGMTQLGVFAKTIALDPAIYLFDEPFSALDHQTSLKLQKQFLDLWLMNQKPTLLVTHNIDEAIFLANKIIILSNLPAKIIAIINNPLARSQILSCLNSNQAQEIKKQILSYCDGFLL